MMGLRFDGLNGTADTDRSDIGMTRWKHFAALVLAIAVSACGSADQRALEAMVAKRMGNPPNLQVSEAVIYREDDARMACLTARWDNQWGEAQPEARFNAWYIPTTKIWATDNPKMPLLAGCQSYTDPNWQAKAAAQIEAKRAADLAEFEAIRNKEIAKASRDAEAQAARDAQRLAEIGQLEAAGSARTDAEGRRLEAEEGARERAADTALEESLRRGPVADSDR